MVAPSPWAGITREEAGTAGVDNVDKSSSTVAWKVLGFAGNDTLIGGNGSDWILVGDGHDDASGGDGDDFIEGHHGDDTLRGNEGYDQLFGGAGNDELRGGAGENTLTGGAGADALYGWNGIDTASYATAPSAGVSVYLDSSDGTNTGDAAGDTYYAIENVLGSNFNDVLHGDAEANSLKGNGGGDTIIGAGGSDHAAGNKGNDLVHGGDGSDFVFGDNDADAVAGGAGNDYVETNAGMDRYADGGAGDDFIAFVSQTDSGGAPDFTRMAITGATADTYFGYNGATGGDGNDLIKAAGLVGFLDGGNGSDIIDGRDANSNRNMVDPALRSGISDPEEAATHIFGGSGNDILIGGGRNNVFHDDRSVVLIDALGGSSKWNDAGVAHADILGGWDDASGASVSLISGITGSGWSDSDVYVLGSNYAYAAGGTYHDTIYGFDIARDKLDFSDTGRTMRDLLAAASPPGTDTGIFAEGNDTVIRFTMDSGAVRRVELKNIDKADFMANQGAIFDVGSSAAVTDAMATLDTLEELYLPNDAGDRYDGYNGDVPVQAFSSTDTAAINLSGGNMSFNNVIRNQGNASDTTVKSVGFGHDIFFDNASTVANKIAGNDGQDILIMRAGHDKAHGDDQADLLMGGLGSDSMEGNRGNDVLIGDEHYADKASGTHEDHLSGGWGDDIADGGAGNDVVQGNYGEDTLYGGVGADTVDGGFGDDVIFGDGKISFSEFSAWIDRLPDAATGDRGGLYAWADDTTGQNPVEIRPGEVEIRYTFGSDVESALYNFDAVATGNGNDFLFGGFGNDTIYGGGGDDDLRGGSGDDSLEGGDGKDTLYGGSGNDTLNGGDLRDEIYGGRGNDQIDGGAGWDLMLDGGDGNDIIRSGAGRDFIKGGNGADTLYGGVHDDVFIFDANDGRDVIHDFGRNDNPADDVDVLRFEGLAASDITRNEVVGADTIIEYGRFNQIVLDGYTGAVTFEFV
ncbi:calcium-binding protein [Roseivivax sp. CAU 1761]